MPSFTGNFRSNIFTSVPTDPNFRFFKEGDGKWNAEPVIKIPKKKVEGWSSEYISGQYCEIF
jgi:hypothetical protein